MSLTNPEARKALRSVIQAIVLIAVVAMVAWVIGLLRGHADLLQSIALALIGIIALSTFFNGAENFRKAKFDISSAGVSGDVDSGDAAQTVADAAQVKADQVKDAVS